MEKRVLLVIDGYKPSIHENKKEAEHFRLQLSNKALLQEVNSKEWIPNAIAAVANASSLAARRAVERISAAAEEALVVKIKDKLLSSFGAERVKCGIEVRGSSGGSRHFDFALVGRSGPEILINGVLPHRASISSKYVAFADTDVGNNRKFAVFDRSLETADAALLQQVATVVPFNSLIPGADRVFA